MYQLKGAHCPFWRSKMSLLCQIWSPPARNILKCHRNRKITKWLKLRGWKLFSQIQKTILSKILKKIKCNKALSCNHPISHHLRTPFRGHRGPRKDARPEPKFKGLIRSRWKIKLQELTLLFLGRGNES